MKREDFSYTVRAVLASAVLFYAWRLSSPGRGWIDWIVIGLVTLAVLWNLVNLGRRFYDAGRSPDIWHTLRTLGFWTIGIMNTALRPDATDSWKVVAGWFVLAIAALDTIQLYRKERDCLQEHPSPAEQAS